MLENLRYLDHLKDALPIAESKGYDIIEFKKLNKKRLS
jgi:hypothetical protein